MHVRTHTHTRGGANDYTSTNAHTHRVGVNKYFE